MSDKKPTEEVLLTEIQRFILNCKDYGMYVDSKVEFENGKLRAKIEIDNYPR